MVDVLAAIYAIYASFFCFTQLISVVFNYSCLDMFYAHTNVLKQQKIAWFLSVSIAAIFVWKLSFSEHREIATISQKIEDPRMNDG